MKEKGIFYENWGEPRQLRYGELPHKIAIDPDLVKIGSFYILVRVRAISVNPVDWKILSGSQRLFTGSSFPRIFGSDFSGDIYKLGKSAKEQGFSEGDRIMGMVSPLTGGSGRQWLMVRADHSLKIPEDISYNEAASLPAAGLSAILATNFSIGKQPGKVLIFGAGGGVGSLALQILSFRKWQITAVAREDQHTLLRSLGCGHFYHRDKWIGELKKEWDAIVDGPAAIIRLRPMKYLNRGGVYSPVFVPDPFIPAQFLRILLWFFSNYSTGLFLAAPSKKRMLKLEKLIKEGAVKPLIDSLWTGDLCEKAVAKSIRGGISGKIVIEI